MLRQIVAMALAPLTATVHGGASVAEAQAPLGLRPAQRKPLDIDALRDAVRRSGRSVEGVFALLCEDAAGALARRLEQADAQHGDVIWPVLRYGLQWYVLHAGSDASSAGRPPLLHLPAS